MRVLDPKILDGVEAFVNEYCSEYGKAPTVMGIANGVGITKTRTLTHLSRLVEQGRIKKLGNTYISKALYWSGSTVETPIVGSVPCGPMCEVDERADGYVRLPKLLTGDGDFFILKASGDSMTGAGIDNEDLVIVRKTKNADVGEIVVAEAFGEVTLKRLSYDLGRHVYFLHPENPEYEDIYPSELSIQGVAVRVIKELK